MVRDAQHLTAHSKWTRRRSTAGSRRSPPTGSTTISASNSPAGTRQHPSRMFLLFADRRIGPADPSRIYSGRIRPTDCNGTSRYEKLRGYLEKAVEAKRNPEPVDQILFFSGNGFISESMVARIDESDAVRTLPVARTAAQRHQLHRPQARCAQAAADERDAAPRPRLRRPAPPRRLGHGVSEQPADDQRHQAADRADQNVPAGVDASRHLARHPGRQRLGAHHAPLRREFPDAWFEGRRRSGRPGRRTPSTSGIWISTSQFRPLHARMPRRVARRLLQRLVPPRQQHRQRPYFQPDAPSPCWPTR